MNQIKKIILFAMLVSAAHGRADSDRVQVKALMHTFLAEISKITETVESGKALSSKDSVEVIGKALNNLEKRVQNPPSALQQTPGFCVTYNLLVDHVAKTKQAFEGGEYEYARMRLLGTTNLCAACHAQAPSPSQYSSFSSFGEKVSKVNFQNANFLFVIRRYDDALVQMDQLVRGYPQSGIGSDLLNDLYRRKLAIFARVKRSPEQAIENFNTDLKNKKLPMDIQKNIGLWVEQFAKWKSEAVQPASLSTPDLIAYVAKNIPAGATRNIAPSDPQVLTFLRFSGLLYERLFTEKDSPQTQELLYYLAMCERSLAPTYWYSVSEIYLKECVVGHPKGAFSKRCFSAYEQGMADRYFGKSLPESVRNSIEALKKYL